MSVKINKAAAAEPAGRNDLDLNITPILESAGKRLPSGGAALSVAAAIDRALQGEHIEQAGRYPVFSSFSKHELVVWVFDPTGEQQMKYVQLRLPKTRREVFIAAPVSKFSHHRDLVTAVNQALSESEGQALSGGGGSLRIEKGKLTADGYSRDFGRGDHQAAQQAFTRAAAAPEHTFSQADTAELARKVQALEQREAEVEQVRRSQEFQNLKNILNARDFEDNKINKEYCTKDKQELAFLTEVGTWRDHHFCHMMSSTEPGTKLAADRWIFCDRLFFVNYEKPGGSLTYRAFPQTSHDPAVNIAKAAKFYPEVEQKHYRVVGCGYIEQPGYYDRDAAIPAQTVCFLQKGDLTRDEITNFLSALGSFQLKEGRWGFRPDLRLLHSEWLFKFSPAELARALDKWKDESGLLESIAKLLAQAGADTRREFLQKVPPQYIGPFSENIGRQELVDILAARNPEDRFRALTENRRILNKIGFEDEKVKDPLRKNWPAALTAGFAAEQTADFLSTIWRTQGYYNRWSGLRFVMWCNPKTAVELLASLDEKQIGDQVRDLIFDLAQTGTWTEFKQVLQELSPELRIKLAGAGRNHRCGIYEEPDFWKHGFAALAEGWSNDSVKEFLVNGTYYYEGHFEITFDTNLLKNCQAYCPPETKINGEKISSILRQTRTE